jgi:asparagine synthase (glutamine-hydrolysing)
MCGILGFLGKLREREYYLSKSKLMRHRGPDWNGIYYSEDENIVVCHERLSIVGIDNGSQPIISECGNYILSVNGEIYNYKNLLKSVLHDRYSCTTKSDCEVIIYLYKEFGINFIKMLDGIFSFILYDIKQKKVLVARDPIGIIPLYHGIDKDNSFTIASELKCFDDVDSVDVMKPGSYICFDYKDKWQKTSQGVYYTPSWKTDNFNIDRDEDGIKNNIRTKLTEAVEKRMMSDVPFGVLLSGGLDSSLIASIASRILKNSPGSFGNKLHTFSIGLKNSPDILAARKVANHLKTEHHELSFTIQDGIDCLKNLIYHLETFDVTTIRASTPMFLMSRKIKSYGIKMVLSGEGADEIFGGYLYFHQAPNNEEFHRECVKRVSNLHFFDCLRANKSTMSWGLEARVPFLDQKFVSYGISIHPELKCKKIEKYILRSAFDCETDPYLPKDILWRQKEQFTDGVGYSWLDSLIEHCEQSITDEEYKELETKYSVRNKEEAYYRKIFEEFFPNKANTIERWVPKTEWDGVSYDPSGRAQKVHKSSI